MGSCERLFFFRELFSFCREAFPFAVRLSSICRESFSFCRMAFLFAVRLILVSHRSQAARVVMIIQDEGLSQGLSRVHSTVSFKKEWLHLPCKTEICFSFCCAKCPVEEPLKFPLVSYRAEKGMSISHGTLK